MSQMSPDMIYEEYMKLIIAHSIAVSLYGATPDEKKDSVWPIVQSVRRRIRELKKQVKLPEMRVYVDGSIYDKPILQRSDGRAFAWADIHMHPLKFRDTWTWQIDYDYDESED